jgi:hypothetical protein
MCSCKSIGMLHVLGLAHSCLSVLLCLCSALVEQLACDTGCYIASGVDECRVVFSLCILLQVTCLVGAGAPSGTGWCSAKCVSGWVGA